MKNTTSRSAALSALIKIFDKNARTDEAIAAMDKNLPHADRKFCAELVYGTVKNVIYIDAVLKTLLRAKKLPRTISAHALRLGAYQIAFGDVPVYAAVGETVEAARMLNVRAPELAMLNAVLRKVETAFESFALPSSVDAHIALKYSHPLWLVRRWIERYGEEFCEKLCAANNTPPPRTFRLNAHSISAPNFEEQLAAAAVRYEQSILPSHYSILDDATNFVSNMMKNGVCTVQDAGFAAPVLALEPKSGERICEIGAAPGGKTTHIAELLTGDTHELFALDNVFERCGSITQNFRRLGMEMPQIVAADGKNLPFANNTFDAVLIDAPCSSLGVIRRHPEIKLRRTEDDFKRLGEQISHMVVAAAGILRSGGRMVFCTCTTEPEENQTAVQTLMELGFEFEQMPATLPDKICESDRYVARGWAHLHNTDGFFCVRAVKP